MPDPRKASMGEDLLAAFKANTLLELSEFVKQFEETLDVKRARPPAVTAAADDSTAPGVKDNDEFDIVLETAGDRRIQVIKEVRSLTGLSLKEAKDLVDSAPTLIGTVGKDALARALAPFEAAGATTSVRGKKSRHRQLLGEDTYRGGIRPPGAHAPESVLIRELDTMLGDRVSTAKALGRPAPQVITWMSGTESPPDDVVFTARALLQVGLTFSAIWNVDLYLDWLVTDNAHLDYARPIDVIAAGRADDVVNAIEAAAYGIYA